MSQALLKRRLFIVSSLYPPHLGGVERYTASLARILSARCRVDVFCLNTENEADAVETDGVTVHYLPCLPLFSGRLPLPKIAALLRFSKLCAALAPDAALIQTRLYPFNAFAVRELAKRGIPTLTVEHGTGYIDLGGRFFNAAWRGYEQFLSGFFRRAVRILRGFSGRAELAARARLRRERGSPERRRSGRFRFSARPEPIRIRRRFRRFLDRFRRTASSRKRRSRFGRGRPRDELRAG